MGQTTQAVDDASKQDIHPWVDGFRDAHAVDGFNGVKYPMGQTTQAVDDASKQDIHPWG